MKKFFYIAVAAIAALSSCSSNEDILGKNGQKATDVTEFTATIEGDATRTSYNSSTKKAEWLTEDKVNIGGAVYTASTAGAETSFTGTGAVKTNDKYKAYYPASMYDDGTITLPAEYAYDGKFNMPMYAESTTEKLNFKNLCGVLAINFPGAQVYKITRIIVSSDKQLSGEVSGITSDGVLTFSEATLTGQNQMVTLTFPKPRENYWNETFYIPVPAMSDATLAITVEDGEHVYSMTSNIGEVNVERNKMYPITFNAPQINGHHYVVLAGLKWATENVPNSDSSPAAGHDPNYGYFFTRDGSKGLSAKEAAESWGSDANGTWKLPTEEQWEKLIDECDWTWRNSSTENGKFYPAGVWVYGKKGTEIGNKIFLPVIDGDFYDHSYDNYCATGYWSSTGDRYLYITGNRHDMWSKSYDVQNWALMVRPVSE